MEINLRNFLGTCWKRITEASSAYILLLLFVLVPFFEYGIARSAIFHYYLGDKIINYIGLMALIWLMSSAIILMDAGPLKYMRLFLFAIAISYYALHFRHASGSFAIAAVMVLFISANKKATLIANSIAVSAALIVLLYAVFGLKYDNNKGDHLSKPVDTVVLVFDEFSLEQVGGYGLLENRVEFPNFSALMDVSDVYYNAVANNLNTERAVPSIIAGRHSNVLGGGYYGDRSLFEKFKTSHSTDAIELVNTFENQFSGGFPVRIFGIVKHYVKTKYINAASDVITDLTTIAKNGDMFYANRHRITGDEFTKEISAGARPFFYFQHLNAPHRPYQWNGKYFYNQSATADLLYQSETDMNSDSTLNMYNYRLRYIDQLKGIDNQLGKMIEALKRANKFDDAAIFITSDHGISFNPGKSARSLEGGNEVPLQFVPLIVKNPKQDKRRDIFEPISNTSVHYLALGANGGLPPQSKGYDELTVNYKSPYVINRSVKVHKKDIAANLPEYEKRLSGQASLFGLFSHRDIFLSNANITYVADEAADYVEVEPGGGNLDVVHKDSDYYPYNVVFSIHGDGTLNKELFVFLDNKLCGSIKINKKQDKYSVYCSEPFLERSSHLDFYKLENGNFGYVPKKRGYAHFSSSPWSGRWEEIRNSAPPTYNSPYSKHGMYLSPNHREVIFVNRATKNIDQRVSYPKDFEFDAVHLYDVNFILTGKKQGQVLVFDYSNRAN